MDCIEARRLIDRGIVPRSYPQQNAELGFHLANCPECRAYREHREALLTNLLLTNQPAQTQQPAQTRPATPTLPPVQPAPPAYSVPPAASLPESSPPNPRSLAATLRHGHTHLNLPRLLWILSLVVLIALPLGGVVWFAGVLIRAHHNVSAMIVPTPSTPDAHAHSTPPPESTQPRALLPPLHVQTPAITTTRSTQTVTEQEHLPIVVNQTAWSGKQPTPTPPPATLTPWPTIQSLLAERPTAWPTNRILPSINETDEAAHQPWAHADTLPSMLQAPPPGDGLTLLFLGNDRRPDEAGIPRTDTIMLARVEPSPPRIALLSLPRDLWVTVPGYGATRINAAYVWGEQYSAPGGGLELARTTISNLLGIQVDYVTMVDFEGFIGLIDTLGGVTVNVEKELYDPSFPTMDYGYTVAHFLPGPQEMDGLTALTYSRTRHPDSDFMRTRRQQAVMVAIGERMRQRGDLQNVISIDRITGALRGYVQTTIPEDRMVGLLWALRSYETASVEHYSITSDMVGWGVGSDSYALTIAPETLNHLVSQFMGTAPPATDQATPPAAP
jgi:LCP family protein required for cell wall assembly